MKIFPKKFILLVIRPVDDLMRTRYSKNTVKKKPFGGDRMKRLLCSILFFVGSISCLPNEELAKAIQESNYDEVQRLTKTIILSTESEQVALIELANDMIISRQHELDNRIFDENIDVLQNYKNSPIVGGVCILIVGGIFSWEMLHKKINGDISAPNWGTIGALSISTLALFVYSIHLTKNCIKMGENIRAAHKNAIKIKQLLYHLPIQKDATLTSSTCSTQ